MRKTIQCSYFDSGKLGSGWEKYFPRYLFEEFEFSGSVFFWQIMCLVQALMRIYIWITLRPRLGRVKKLDIEEVEEVYNKEAETYDLKHHNTTRGQDTAWRRVAAFSAVNLANKNNGQVKVLDLCTGTGLTIVEISKVFELWNIPGQIIGFDYNAEMLAVAKKRKFSEKINVDFMQGDAKRLAETSVRNVDLITQVFGIGGIDEPIRVFKGAIEVLRPGGQFLLIDMHRPIPALSGEWPFFFKWFSSPLFEALTYEKTTVPLALNRLWGWRDPTLDFYLLPLVTSKSGDGRYFGWEVLYRSVVSERWWFGLPIMPTATALFEKKEISKSEAEKRRELLELIAC